MEGNSAALHLSLDLDAAELAAAQRAEPAAPQPDAAAPGRTSRQCAAGGCTSRSSFNWPGAALGLFCGSHKAEGMVNVRNKPVMLSSCAFYLRHRNRVAQHSCRPRLQTHTPLHGAKLPPREAWCDCPWLQSSSQRGLAACVRACMVCSACTRAARSSRASTTRGPALRCIVMRTRRALPYSGFFHAALLPRCTVSWLLVCTAHRLVLLCELHDGSPAADAGAGHGEREAEGLRGARLPQSPQLQLGGRRRGRVVQQAQGRGHGGCAQQDVRARRLPQGEPLGAVLIPRAGAGQPFAVAAQSYLHVRPKEAPLDTLASTQYTCTVGGDH